MICCKKAMLTDLSRAEESPQILNHAIKHAIRTTLLNFPQLSKYGKLIVGHAHVDLHAFPPLYHQSVSLCLLDVSEAAAEYLICLDIITGDRLQFGGRNSCQEPVSQEIASVHSLRCVQI